VGRNRAYAFAILHLHGWFLRIPDRRALRHRTWRRSTLRPAFTCSVPFLCLQRQLEAIW
jgi:hypothetical protein